MDANTIESNFMHGNYFRLFGFIQNVLVLFQPGNFVHETIIKRLDLRRAPILLQRKALFACAYRTLPV